MAWPIVLHPSQMVYGREIVGRHPEVHAAIAEIAGEPATALQPPLTMMTGRMLATAVGPIAALNLVVLLSFPLSAMCAYALARFVTASHGAALVAGLVFAFAPTRLAQAAYHPYLVQTHWLPLYFLCLAALVNRVTAFRIVATVVTGIALLLSNYDLAYIGAVMTPIVLLSFWVIRPDADRNLWPLVWPLAVAGLVVGAGVALVANARPDVLRASADAFSIEDIGFYRARWWAYFTPSVSNPFFGQIAERAFGRAGVNLALVELQVFLGYAFVALAAGAVIAAIWHWRRLESRAIIAVAAIGLAAAIISVGPASGSCGSLTMAPGCLAFRVLPVFRTYARFAIVVNLAVAIAAGAGAMWLAKQSAAGRAIATVLLIVGAIEFFPLPARAHDVLPTAAHRALAVAAPGTKILDCYPSSGADVWLPWLMKDEVTFLDAAVPTCADPDLGTKLAALHYTNVIVRGGAASSKLLTPLPPGITQAQQFADSNIYNVSRELAPVVTVGAAGFFAYEHDGDDWWRWMSPQGRWTVKNTTAVSQRVTLSVDLAAIGSPRRLTVSLDGGPATTIAVDVKRAVQLLGPWTLAPGDHTLVFSADGEAVRPTDFADNSSDRRPLTVAFRQERWINE